MQLTNAPAKLVLPFANAGGKNTIPAASQIGITAGAASLTDGFPPLTRTPIAAGGVPPSGLDMNGILNAVSAITRWANAGAGYVYDATFASDSNVGGYPKGARVLRTDGLGYWINTTDNNTTDPEAGGAGWFPDFTTGATAVTMTNANVTLTALQYGKRVIVITGTLTANVQLIFPAIVGEWAVINSTNGAFTITCKTASGSGVAVAGVRQLVGDGTNIYAVDVPAVSVQGAFNNLKLSAGGTAASISVSYDELVLGDGAGTYATERNVSATITTTVTGAGGLDTGTLATSTWYSIWRIGKTDGTRAFLFSLSATAPTMPSGYTLKARIGWFRTDGTANKYPLGFIQYGRKVRYKTATGSNVTGYPLMASGVQGTYSDTAPTWVALSVVNFVPSTAQSIAGMLQASRTTAGATGAAVLAPNNSFTGNFSTTNPPPVSSNMVSIGNAQTAVASAIPFDMVIESTNVYYASLGTGSAISCTGWEDNL